MTVQMKLSEIIRAVEHTRRFNEHVENGGALLDAMMPNGKRLGDCTGKEVGAIGAWLQEAGRRLNEFKSSVSISGLLDWDPSDDRKFPRHGRKVAK